MSYFNGETKISGYTQFYLILNLFKTIILVLVVTQNFLAPKPEYTADSLLFYLYVQRKVMIYLF